MWARWGDEQQQITIFLLTSSDVKIVNLSDQPVPATPCTHMQHALRLYLPLQSTLCLLPTRFACLVQGYRCRRGYAAPPLAQWWMKMDLRWSRNKGEEGVEDECSDSCKQATDEEAGRHMPRCSNVKHQPVYVHYN
jgi:hypothetical protein